MMTGTSSQDKQDQLQFMAAELCQFVRHAAQDGQPIHEVELGVWNRVLRMGREAMGAFVQMQGTGDVGATVTLPEGEEVRRLEMRRTRPYRSVFGDIEIERTVYGTREGQKIQFVPLDQRLGLPECDYSYVLQDWAQALGVQESYSKVSELLGRILKLDVPVDSLERMNRHMSEPVASFRQSRPAPPEPEEGSILVATGDNKGIPMRRSRDQTAGAAPAGARRKKGEKANKKQMAMVGCVYTVNPKHRTPQEVIQALFRERRRDQPRQEPEPKAQHKRIWSSLSQDGKRGQDEVFKWMAQEMAARLLAEQELVCLMDGQPSLWNDCQEYLATLDIVNIERLVEILDLLHVTTRVWEAAHLFHAEGSDEAQAFARARILRILEGGVGYVIGGLRQMATKQKLRGHKLKRLKAICGYFEKNKHRMRYDEYLARGYPIASGVIEGACRYVVKDRMERAGMRWTVPGAQAMLDLRTTYVNDQWDDYQAWRIDQETQRLYPHASLQERIPWPLAA